MTQSTKVKICGIATLDDARAAIEAGAAMLGFNFYPKSPRYIAPENAKKIVAEVSRQVECVGVFVNEPVSSVLATVSSVGLGTAQLHGDESPEYCKEISRACGVIKALRVGDGFRAESAAGFGGRILLDTATAQYGGSGKSFDWSIVSHVRRHADELILAGGIHPGNVIEAIEVAGPDGVDVCSGAESAPGKKDPDKILALMAAVREADARRRAKVLSA